jgi:predicted alpha/beta-hydrolase family hydrolase
MQKWKERLATIGEVETFDYSYMRQGSRRPDPLPLLIAAHREALANARPDIGRPTFLIGKSMGGRVGCHVSLEAQVTGVVCLSYPLCAGGDTSKLRDKVLREMRAPVLFIQGTRDPLCPLELLQTIRAGMTCANSLHIVEGGDHSLLAPKRQLREAGETQEDVDQRILEAIVGFVGPN